MADAAAAAQIDGSALGLAWGLPFVGLLLSIALGPQVAPRLWHRHFGKVAALWSALALGGLAVRFGWGTAAHAVLETALHEYLPFVVLLAALFTIAGGVRIQADLGGTPASNTALLAFGTLLASVAGTTGAAMLLVRPLIQGNLHRPRKAHVLVFFIFLVANIGGGLTPIGDPPLFLGFLQGVSFGWTLTHMAAPLAICAGLVLAIFFGIDSWLWRRDGGPAPHRRGRRSLSGWRNLGYLALAVGAVMLSGVWRPDIAFDLRGVRLELQSVVRDGLLAGLGWLSWRTTPRRWRLENAFTWEPLAEVVWLFAGIFITLIPILAILRAGSDGALAPLVALANGADGQPRVAAYFWTTGLLSSVLDNAPTYLVFFNLAGGDAARLMGPLARTLLAISAGAVFMGALTYLGNAPNFMVRAIAQERGVKMPSFLGYMAWAAAVLLPVFALLTVLFFR